MARISADDRAKSPHDAACSPDALKVVGNVDGIRRRYQEARVTDPCPRLNETAGKKGGYAFPVARGKEGETGDRHATK